MLEVLHTAAVETHLVVTLAYETVSGASYDSCRRLGRRFCAVLSTCKLPFSILSVS